MSFQEKEKTRKLSQEISIMTPDMDLQENISKNEKNFYTKRKKIVKQHKF